MRKTIHSREQAHLTALLRRLRHDAGLRQVDLARRLRRPQSFVSKYETGERRLDLVELHQVCKALGISLGAFVANFERAIQPARKRTAPVRKPANTRR